MSKSCSKCKVDKPLTEFHLRSINRDGRRADCKECNAKYRKSIRKSQMSTCVVCSKPWVCVDNRNMVCTSCTIAGRRCRDCRQVLPVSMFCRRDVGSKFICKTCFVDRSVNTIKVCVKCNVSKLLGEYRVDRLSRDGYKTRCKACMRVEESKRVRIRAPVEQKKPALFMELQVDHPYVSELPLGPVPAVEIDAALPQTEATERWRLYTEFKAQQSARK